jgi:hypothetical protein
MCKVYPDTGVILEIICKSAKIETRSLGSYSIAAELKRSALHTYYHQVRWSKKPTDLVRQFRAYVVSFNSADADAGDG